MFDRCQVTALSQLVNIDRNLAYLLLLFYILKTFPGWDIENSSFFKLLHGIPLKSHFSMNVC